MNSVFARTGILLGLLLTGEILGLTASAQATPAVAVSEKAQAVAPAEAKPAPSVALEPDLNLGSQPSPDETPRSFGKELIQFVVVLGLVLALIYITLNFGLRRLLSLQRASWGRSELVSVVERIPLEARACMYVVKAGSDHLLIGRTEQGMSLLHTLSAEDVEKVRREKPPPQLSPFLQKLLSRRRGPPPTA